LSESSRFLLKVATSLLEYRSVFSSAAELAADLARRQVDVPAASSGLPRSWLRRAARVGEKQFFQRRTSRTLQAAPSVHRHQNGGLRAALGDRPRTFAQAGIQELAEACLGVLNRPAFVFKAPSR
jgi:hypothetical protein